MTKSTKFITSLALLSALAFILVLTIRIPIVPGLDFLKYEPKDIAIVIGGFIYGPLASLIVSVIVALIEMVTISTTGIIGCAMNILGSVSFACVASIIYKKIHNTKGAIMGLIAGVICMTAVMLLWNYFLTPIYTNLPREEIVKLLAPAILPFNLIKAGINAGIAVVIYKPVVTALRKANLVPQIAKKQAVTYDENGVEIAAPQKSKFKISIGIVIFAVVILASCLFGLLALKGII